MKFSRREWLRLASSVGVAQFLAPQSAFTQPQTQSAQAAQPLFLEIPPSASHIDWVHENAISPSRYLPEALNPNLPDVHVLYAKALQFTGDSDLSVKQFKAELELDPYNFDANLQLGAIARQEQNHEQAHQCLARALRTRPGDPGVRYQLAVIAVDEGKPEEARQILESLVKESPQFTEAHVSLSLVYYRLKRPADGKHEQEIAQKLTDAEQAKQPGVKAQ